MTLDSFLLFFGVLNALTPVIMMSATDSLSQYSNTQRGIMRNMFVCGVCLIFVALGMMFFG
jgi:hypothetical protein